MQRAAPRSWPRFRHGALNLEAAGAVFSKFGERAIRGGDELVLAIGLHNLWACGWPGPEIRDLGVNLREG